MALEFELAADILRTAVTPTWTDLGKLAAIVVIRTAINYFLQQEIDKATRDGVDARRRRGGTRRGGGRDGPQRRGDAAFRIADGAVRAC